jgi:hypothetical protein
MGSNIQEGTSHGASPASEEACSQAQTSVSGADCAETTRDLVGLSGRSTLPPGHRTTADVVRRVRVELPGASVGSTTSVTFVIITASFWNGTIGRHTEPSDRQRAAEDSLRSHAIARLANAERFALAELAQGQDVAPALEPLPYLHKMAPNRTILLNP